MKFLISFFISLFIITQSSAEDLKSVTLQLQWKNTFEFSGFFVAKERGYYKDVGLDVEIKEWDNGINVVNDVASKKSAYGVARPSSIADIANGKDIIYLLAIYQSNPLILLADKKSGIKSISDLKNKRTMLTDGHMVDASIISLLASQNIAISDLKILKHSFDVHDLLNDKADVMAAYISNEPFILEEAGGNPIMFNSKDYGFDFYNDFLIVSRDYLEHNQNEVRDFRYATIKGYEYAFSHIDEIVELIYKKYNTLNKSKKALLREAKELKRLAYYKTEKFGDISSKRLKDIYNVYKLLGITKHGINIDKIVYKNITLDTKLNDKEKQYLQNKGQIRLCVDPNWLPYDKIDKNGKHVGISADYMSLIKKALSINVKLVKTSSWGETLKFAKDGKCDVVTSVTKTPQREEYLNFTTPYNKFPLVTATKMDVSFVNGIEDLKGKKIGVANGYAFVEIAKKKYPDISIVEVKNIDEGLQKVNSGELFAFLDTLPSIAYFIQSKQSVNLKISGKIYDHWKISIGTKKDDKVLFDIFQKAINSITNEQKQDILNRWISVKYEGKTDYKLIWEIVLVSLVALMLIIIWNRKINSKNILLQKAQDEIEEKNRILRTLATTDRLTGIYNRLKLDTILEEELARSRRYKNRFGVAILDIDHFKNVNDTYGHQAGDAVLKEIAKLLLENIRVTDNVGRWGGEEFLMICIEIDKGSLFALMEKIREKIKSHNFLHVDRLTVSIGLTLHKENDTVQGMIKRADDALYKAKNSGRDMVEIL